MNEDITYDVPDVEPDEGTNLSVWPVLRNGAEIGRIVETERGYRGETKGNEGRTFPERPFREQAIQDVTGSSYGRL